MESIIRAEPGWAPLLSALPVRYVSMPAERRGISASSFAWPQHVLLSGRAFATMPVLAEQVLHEHFHQWLYLCEELAALHHDGCTDRFTLPSGTGNRSPGEVLGATHVATGLQRLWQHLDVPPSVRTRRLDDLAGYLSGCRALLDEIRPCLTADGHALAERLLEASA